MAQSYSHHIMLLKLLMGMPHVLEGHAPYDLHGAFATSITFISRVLRIP